MKRGVWIVLPVIAACGGSTPPPKTDEGPKQESHESHGPELVVEQEFGSIDERAVESTFSKLEGQLEKCHSAGRERVEYEAGDVKVYLRIGKDGRVKWGWFEESTLGDRQTERCILDVFNNTAWPKPVGGDAEVRHGFGWGGGGERAPTNWGPEKVMSALDDAKDVKTSIAKCKSGVKGEFRVTVYVEQDDSPPPKPKGPPPKKGAGPAHDKGGKIRALGIVPPNKEGNTAVDCIADALKDLRVPSPGSYAAKTTFPL